jgi:hypothetical protein
MRSADNQQERLDSQWITGFVDGEGCFHVAINKIQKMTIGFQVLPEFRVVQHVRDIQILKRIRDTLGTGVVRKNNVDRYEVRVRRLSELNKIVDFFKRFPLMTKKRQDFKIFKEIIEMMNNKEHLNREGIVKIEQKAFMMNRQTKNQLSRILRDYTPKTQEPDCVMI